MVLWFPVLVRGDRGQEIAGTMAGALRLKDLLDKTLPPLIHDDFWISVFVAGQEVFNTREEYPDLTPPEETLNGEKNMELMGLEWKVKVWPKSGGAYNKLSAGDHWRLSVLVVLSLLVSTLLGVSLHALHRVRKNRQSRQRSEKRYQTLVNSATDGIMVLDPDGYVLDANPAACASLGYSLEELNLMNLSSVLEPTSAKALPEFFTQLKRRKHVSCELTHLTRTGTLIPVEMQGNSFEFEGIPAILTMSRDISQRMQAIQALAESEQRLRAIFKQAGVGIMQCGPDNQIQHANDKLCQILGYSRQELTGMGYHTLCFAEDRPETQTRFNVMVKQKNHTGLWKKRLRQKSGKPIWVKMTTSLIHSEQGEYLYSIDVVEDITKQHKLEQQLRQAQKMESIGILAGGIAHDFNNILGSILGFTQMALVDTPTNSKTRQRLEHVFKAANLAKDLVRQILTFSRRSEDTPQAIRVSPIIKETLKFLKALVPANIEIRQDLKALDGTVMADPTQIHQILMNLGTNAAQAMAMDGGILTVCLTQEEMDSDSADDIGIAPGPYVLISVSDTGVGMGKDILDRIFEPYFTTKEVGEGTGMGLAVVHGIVWEYEGKILVESRQGHGSCFRIFLPKIQPDPIPLPLPDANIPKGRERILLVDDNLSLLTVGQEMLEHLGYQVELFSDPVQALNRIMEGPENFQVVITDYAMPRMTGIELADRILQARLDVAIILCTGNNQNLNFEELLHSGIKSILIKPLVLEELAPALKAALNKNKAVGKS